MPVYGDDTKAVTFTSEQAVRVMYRASFGRDPEPDGLQQHADALCRNPDDLLEMALRFHTSDEHEAVMRRAPAIRDHSQHGEFPLLLKHMLRTGQKHGIIVDVGARSRERSNSWDLMKTFGWRGLLVEANPALIDSLREEFAGLAYELISCAVGPEPGFLPFFVGENADVSSLIRENVVSWGAIKNSVNVEVRRLGEIMHAHGVPFDFDILSLDIEGLDVEVFNDLVGTTPYRPSLVVIEASFNFASKSMDDVPFSKLAKAEYDLVDQTPANLILGLRAER